MRSDRSSLADSAAASETLARIVRDEAGILVGSLVRTLGDFELAEDAVQDAILEALDHWPASGVPDRASAWLRATARRKAIDRLRREARHRDKLQLLGRLESSAATSESNVMDERLALIFTCCHPALSREAQIALTLRSVLGLTTAQIARAFLTTETTVAKRIVRAKRKIVDAGIPFRVPSGEALRGRLSEVLSVVYLMFNEGYLSTGPEASGRGELADDAEWLARLLLHLLSSEPEIIGLLVLIRLHQARRAGRFDRDGHLVLLKDQDRSLWDRRSIDDSVALLTQAMALGLPGPYQAQAAIAACHALARRWEDTDWYRIVALYDTLLRLTHSPIVSLNRAIAVAHLDGPQVALVDVDRLAEPLSDYHLFHATRAQLLRELGRTHEASEEDRIASRLTRNPAELRLLQQRIEGLA